MHCSRFTICSAALFLLAAACPLHLASSATPDSQSFEANPAERPANPVASFESRGFKVTYRDRDGKEISKADFDRRGKDTPVAMRVDGDTKTVEIALDGDVPPELDVPLSIAPGDPLPLQHFVDLSGKSHAWPRLDGKYTLLDFYFSGCGPCIQAIPELNEFQRARPDIATLAITFDDAGESKRFVAERKLAWDVVPDARGVIETIGVTVYPTLMLVDPRGKLVAVRDVVTAATAGDVSLEAWVRQTLAEPRR